MLTSARMSRIRIIVLKRDADATTEAVGRLGAVQLSETQRVEGEAGDRAATHEKIARCKDLLDRLGELMKWLDVPLPELPGEHGRPRVDLDAVDGLLTTVRSRTAAIGEQLAAIDEQIQQTQETIEQLAPYRDLRVAPRELAQTSFLHVASGDMPAWQIPAAREALPDDCVVVPIGVPGVPVGAEPDEFELRRVLALSSRRSRFAMQTVLEGHQFKAAELPTSYESAPAAVHDAARASHEQLRKRREGLCAPLRELGGELAEDLTGACLGARLALRLAEAELSFGETWATVIIDGWCPTDQVDTLREAVERVTAGQAVFESHEATAGEIAQGLVPTCAKLPGWLRPFGTLVRGMGEPGYQEIEPTLLFAVSFLVLFGIIFGDLGHGLCLLAIGLAVRRRSRSSEGRTVGYLVAAAGVGSALFGVFFQGAFFGKSLAHMGWPLTLGLEPLHLELGGDTSHAASEVQRYLLIALGAGFVLISTGVVLNIVNCLRVGDYRHGVLGRFGVVGIFFYWGAVALGVKVALAGPTGADLWLVLGLIVVPLAVVALGEPIYAIVTRRRRLWEESPVIGLFEGVVEAFETVMTYVANTFSFLRVAAFALSHAAMGFAVFVLLDLVKEGPGVFVWRPVVFVLGTALIIGLEGMIVLIQVCRLEYYEFFTKFFTGSGRRFTPFRLDGSSE